jgi:hypothetical protein
MGENENGGIWGAEGKDEEEGAERATVGEE